MTHEIEAIADSLIELQEKHRKRVLIAIAGPPGSGKSTLAETLIPLINNKANSEAAAILPMDGFHLDNNILDAHSSRDRKGAPHTFDAEGFIELVTRIAAAQASVAVPVFDRHLDLARAGARIIPLSSKIIIVEGNYLLLNQQPWDELHSLFDYRIYLDVSEHVLSERLTQRWLDHGHTADQALTRAESNDLPNARLVAAHRLDAEMVIRNA